MILLNIAIMIYEKTINKFKCYINKIVVKIQIYFTYIVS